MFFFMEGMKRSGAAEASIILSTSPIFTKLFASLARQSRITFAGIVGGIVAFGGVALVVAFGEHSGNNTLFGNLLILISSMLWAVCAVMTRSLVVDRSPLAVLTMSMPGALIVLIPYGLMDTLHTPWNDFTAVTWGSLLFNAVMAGAVGFLGFFAGVKKIGAGGAMMYQFFVPPITAFFAWIILHDPLSPMQFVGILVVLAGVYWASTSSDAIVTRPLRPSPQER